MTTSRQARERSQTFWEINRHARRSTMPVPDLEEWQSYTPTITFGTPGDLSVTYAVQRGWYQKLGNLVLAGGNIETSAFTHSTAAGSLRVSLPLECGDEIPLPNANLAGALNFSGWTKSGYTQVGISLAAGFGFFNVWATGSAVPFMGSITPADLPSGGTVRLSWQMFYSWKLPI